MDPYIIVNHDGKPLKSYALEARVKELIAGETGTRTYEVWKVYQDGSGERLVQDQLTLPELRNALETLRYGVEADEYDTQPAA